MPQLETGRLRLVALNSEALLALLGRRQVESGLPCRVAEGIVTPDVARAAGTKLRKMMLAPPADLPWLTYWLLVLREEDLGIGLAGFKGAPDRMGYVEIGYGLAGPYRRRGYMTEAVRALVDWAFAQPRCRAVLADTNTDNVASQRVLRRVGMSVVGRTATGIVWQVRRDGRHTTKARRGTRPITTGE